MKRKFTFLLIALLALAGFKSWGQTEIQIGDGQYPQSFVPFYNYYKYSYAQMLYLGSEIGESGTITSISFHNSRTSSLSNMKFNIYMKCVSKDSYSGNSDWVVVTDKDLVYSATLNTIPGGWATFTLDTPFEYDNTQGNLMIAFDNNTGNCTTSNNCAQFYYTSTIPTYTCIYYYNDYTHINPTNPTQQANGTTYQRPDIKIMMEPAASCPKPNGLAVSNITATGATISWNSSEAESYDLAYGVASTFDLSNPATYTLQNNLTTTSVQLSGLTAETEYKCAVKAHCSAEEESAWSIVVTFTPTAALTVYNDGQNGSNVPFNTLYSNELGSAAQFVIPAEILIVMNDAEITRMKFYVKSCSDPTKLEKATYTGYMTEVSQTTTSSFIDFDSAKEIFNGHISLNSDSEIVVDFSEPYLYNGGNLAIAFLCTENVVDIYTSTEFYGSQISNSSIYRNRTNDSPKNKNFIPKTTFTYIPGVTRYNVTCDNAITGGSISANPVKAVPGTVVNLSATPAYGYEFGAWVENYDDVTIVDNQFTMPEHDVTISATFNALPTYDIISAVVIGGTVHAEYDNVTITEAPEGTVITLVAEAAADYIFEYFTVDGAQIPGTTYTMGTSAIEIGASFRAVQSYTIHYYVNGVFYRDDSKKETQYISTFTPLYVYIPAGTEFVGWSFDDIETYTTTKPSTIGYNEVHPTQECNLYAVLSYGGENNIKYYVTKVTINEENKHITGNTEVANMIINNGTTITIDNGAILNVSGLCQNDDPENLVIEDGGQLIVNNSGVQATMKKNIGSNTSKASNVNWYTISSPLAVENTAFADVTNLIPNNVTGIDYDLYRFDEANGMWINSRIYGTDGTTIIENEKFKTIDKGVGYIYHNNANTKLEFKGEINVNNVTGVSLTLTADKGKGYNLVGNPFTQNIKLTDVTGVTLAEGFYVLTNQNTWGTKLIESDIKPLQGFLVQVKTAGTATISKPAAKSKGERSNEQNTNIEVIVSNGSYRDNAYAMFGEGTGLNKVNHRNAEAPMLYIPQDGEDFAIAFMDENTTIFPVSFKAMTTSSYSIRLKATDDVSTLVLVDNMTGEETNMLLEDSYTFIGSPADNENRFTVKLKISNSQDEDEHFAYQNGNELIINGEGTLQIFDVLGRVVISEEVHGQTVNVGGLNTGAYIVRLTGESVKTQKIVVR